MGWGGGMKAEGGKGAAGGGVGGKTHLGVCYSNGV
jgi:hypothetical protein